MLCDKNGIELDIGTDVEVPEPSQAFHDIHNHGFMGSIINFNEDEGTVCVSDQDGDCFDVEAERVEVY